MVILHAIQSIFSIFIMISIGYVLTAKGWFTDQTSKTFSQLVTTVSLPTLMIYNLTTTFDRDMILHLGNGLLIPTLSMLSCYIIGFIVSKIIHVPSNRRGVFRTMFFMSNTIFIGLPVNLALFGEQSVPYVLFYYMVNTILFWTIGVHAICNDCAQQRVKLFSIGTLKNIISPPLIGFFVAILLVLFQIPVPSFIMDTCKYLGNLTTPLSMMFIGMAVCGVKLKDIRLSKDMLAIFIARFIISPLSVFVLCYFFPVPVLMKKVFVMQAAMPVITQVSIIAKAYGADAEYSAVITTVSNILAIVVIPVYMLLFEMGL